MKSYVVIGVTLFATWAAHAANLDCYALVKKNHLSGEQRRNFLNECLVDQVRVEQARLAMRLPPPPGQRGIDPGAQCKTVEDCDDLSVQLEAPAAGISRGTKANSGQTFVPRRGSEQSAKR